MTPTERRRRRVAVDNERIEIGIDRSIFGPPGGKKLHRSVRAMAAFEEGVVATTVAVAAVTKANTKIVRMNSFCIATPSSPWRFMPISSAIVCDSNHRITGLGADRVIGIAVLANTGIRRDSRWGSA